MPNPPRSLCLHTCSYATKWQCRSSSGPSKEIPHNLLDRLRYAFWYPKERYEYNGKAFKPAATKFNLPLLTKMPSFILPFLWQLRQNRFPKRDFNGLPLKGTPNAKLSSSFYHTQFAVLIHPLHLLRNLYPTKHFSPNLFLTPTCYKTILPHPPKTWYAPPS